MGKNPNPRTGCGTTGLRNGKNTPNPNPQRLSMVLLASSTDSSAEMGMSGGSQTGNLWIVSKNRELGV